MGRVRPVGLWKLAALEAGPEDAGQRPAAGLRGGLFTAGNRESQPPRPGTGPEGLPRLPGRLPCPYGTSDGGPGSGPGTG